MEEINIPSFWEDGGREGGREGGMREKQFCFVKLTDGELCV